jgi:uncharacterized damage-inducible protein DinB
MDQIADDILSWAATMLGTTPARWLQVVQSVPAALLLARPAPGEWAALECLHHLVDTERLSMPIRVQALLAGQPFPGFNPAEHDSHQAPTIALAEEFSRLRQENLALLAQVTTADLDRRARHADYGMVSMREFLHHWVGHDLMHTVQAERALLQPCIRGSGPWRVNYTDHLATGAEG